MSTNQVNQVTKGGVPVRSQIAALCCIANGCPTEGRLHVLNTFGKPSFLQNTCNVIEAPDACSVSWHVCMTCIDLLQLLCIGCMRMLQSLPLMIQMQNITTGIT